MRRLIAIAFAATALCAGAAAPAQQARDAAVTPVPGREMHPGYGVVESVTAVRVVAPRSAATGGSARGPSQKEDSGRPAYRVAVRMGDGSLQYRDLDKPEFKPGDNVLLTNAGDVVPD
jgi:hypothetical protein